MLYKGESQLAQYDQMQMGISAFDRSHEYANCPV